MEDETEIGSQATLTKLTIRSKTFFVMPEFPSEPQDDKTTSPLAALGISTTPDVCRPDGDSDAFRGVPKLNALSLSPRGKFPALCNAAAHPRPS